MAAARKTRAVQHASRVVQCLSVHVKCLPFVFLSIERPSERTSARTIERTSDRVSKRTIERWGDRALERSIGRQKLEPSSTRQMAIDDLQLYSFCCACCCSFCCAFCWAMDSLDSISMDSCDADSHSHSLELAAVLLPFATSSGFIQ